MTPRCLLLLPLVLAVGCASGPTRETKSYPVMTFEKDITAVKEATRQALRDARFSIDTASAEGFHTETVQDRGFSWKLDVRLGRGTGYVSVAPSLDLARYAAPRPVRKSLTNMGHMSHEESRRPPGSSSSASYEEIREDRIRSLEERVFGFLTDLERRLRPQDP